MNEESQTLEEKAQNLGFRDFAELLKKNPREAYRIKDKERLTKKLYDQHTDYMLRYVLRDWG